MKEKFGEEINERIEEDRISLVDFLEKHALAENEITKDEIKEILMKAKSLRATGEGILAHRSKIENLERILQEGILSRKFVEKTNKKVRELPRGYYPEFQEQYGMEKISLFDGDIAKQISLKIYEADYKHLMSKEEFLAGGFWPTEATVQFRVATRFLSGLIFNSTTEITDKQKESLIEFLKRYKISVYNENGDIIWPKKVAQNEIKEWLEQETQAD